MTRCPRLEPVSREEIESYLKHHLNIAGSKQFLHEESAITAIFQESKGLYRRINHLARGALIAAASKQAQLVNAEHVGLASTELI